MSNPLTSFIRDLVRTIKAEFAERRRHKENRRRPASAEPVSEKKVVVARANHRSKSARQARRITRNRG
ncbi:hypothetical protein [Rhizobium paknamense]|uniref:Uncharacterized protein n=1 Tax=Rhizobium paknamense TaxID=1206817 RepID=A0ABU0ICP9_9HYPH|nr:hypothetical protein [Rhizobium paknamense]MDQ0456012.1 hypothetical protein [Rhizobium paknamense]